MYVIYRSYYYATDCGVIFFFTYSFKIALEHENDDITLTWIFFFLQNFKETYSTQTFMDNIIRNFQYVFVTMIQVNKGYNIWIKNGEGVYSGMKLRSFN